MTTTAVRAALKYLVCRVSGKVICYTEPCWHCHKASTLIVDPDRLRRWKAGELIQNVWPNWSKGRRERLMTGIHPRCWNRMCDGADQ